MSWTIGSPNNPPENRPPELPVDPSPAEQDSDSEAPAFTLPTLPDWAICLALVLSIFAVYSRVTGFDFVNYDDRLYVYENPHVRTGLSAANIEWALTAVVSNNWMPVTLLSHMLDAQLFGLHAGMHHLVNVLFHALASVLLFIWLRRATAEYGKRSRALSGFVAFVFALHPLHVSSVAWIAERKDVLSACFCFLALLAWSRYAERPGAGRYLAVAALFALGLMAKPMLVTFPFLLLLVDLWPLQRVGPGKAAWPRLLLEKLPLIALSVADSVVTYRVQDATGAVTVLPLATRAENAFVSYLTYIGQMFWPVHLSALYPYRPSIPPWQAAAAFLIVLAISALAVRAWRSRPWFAAGWFWYLGTLVPVIGFVQVGEQAHADRYMYLPMIGLTIVLAWGAQEVIAKWPRAKPLLAAGFIFCEICMALSWFETAHWRDNEALWGQALAVTSNNTMAEYNLATHRAALGRFSEAIPHFEAAIRITPGYVPAHNNLGVALMHTGDYAAAIPHLELAVRALPDFAEARRNLATSLMVQGNYGAAVTLFESVLRAYPNDADSHSNLGLALMRGGNDAAAVPHFEAAIRFQPEHAEAHYNLGIVHYRHGDYGAAASQFGIVCRVQPDHFAAHYYLGLSLAKAEAKAGAKAGTKAAGGASIIAEYEGRLRANSADAAAHAGLGGWLSGLGRNQEAVAQLEAALLPGPNPAIAQALAALQSGQRQPAHTTAAGPPPARH